MKISEDLGQVPILTDCVKLNLIQLEVILWDVKMLSSVQMIGIRVNLREIAVYLSIQTAKSVQEDLKKDSMRERLTIDQQE